MNPEAMNIIDGHLQDLKYMVEFAAELSDELDGNGARKAISRMPATVSPFCCNDTLRRVNELIGILSKS